MAKRNKRYWQERAAEHRKIIDKDAEQIIRETQAAYERSLHHIDGEIARWYQRFADAEEITMEEARQRMNAGELNQFRMTLEEYIARGEQLDLDPSWADALEKASALHHIDRYDAMRTIIRAEMEELKAKTRGAGWMDQIAEDAYLHMIYSMSREMQMAIAFNQPDIERLKQLIKEPWAPDGVDFVKRTDINMDKLAAEITKKLQQACITGQPYRELAADIEKTVGLKAYEAERIIRTECTNISSLSEQAAYNTAGIEEYEVLATLDAKTCELCGQMDGHVEAVEKMEPGVNAPPFHPNCRCTTIGHYEDGIDETRIARDENGKTIYVPGDMTWAEWKAQYGTQENFDDYDITEGGKYMRLPADMSASGYTAYMQPHIEAELKGPDNPDGLSLRDYKQLWNKQYGYIQASPSYQQINAFWRDPKGSRPLTREQHRTRIVLQNVTRKFEIPEPFIGYRKVDAGFLAEFMGIDVTGSGRGFNYRSKTSAQAAVDAINKKIREEGISVPDKAVTSVSLVEGLNYFDMRPVLIEIQMPDGTKGLLTDNYKESEFIAKNRSSLEFIGATSYNYRGKTYIKMFAKMIQ